MEPARCAGTGAAVEGPGEACGDSIGKGCPLPVHPVNPPPIPCTRSIGSIRSTTSAHHQEVVPATGLEPVRCYSLEPESSASANSATTAHGYFTMKPKKCKCLPSQKYTHDRLNLPLLFDLTRRQRRHPEAQGQLVG